MRPNIINLTNDFLANRPAFFSLIRPIELKLLLDHQKKLSGKVLDFGCGDGFFAQTLFKYLNHSGQLIGVDLFDSRIDQAKEKLCYHDVIEYDGVSLPFLPNTFDSCFSNSVLEHASDLRLSLKEIYRVMKPGGFFLTTVMTDNWGKNLIGGKLFGNVYRRWLREKQVHTELLTVEDWSKAFSQSGFEVINGIEYLCSPQAEIMELAHYLSLPSLLGKRLFNRWVLFPNYHYLSPLAWLIRYANSRIDHQLKKSNKILSNQARAALFILKK